MIRKRVQGIPSLKLHQSSLPAIQQILQSSGIPLSGRTRKKLTLFLSVMTKSREDIHHHCLIINNSLSFSGQKTPTAPADLLIPQGKHESRRNDTTHRLISPTVPPSPAVFMNEQSYRTPSPRPLTASNGENWKHIQPKNSSYQKLQGFF